MLPFNFLLGTKFFFSLVGLIYFQKVMSKIKETTSNATPPIKKYKAVVLFLGDDKICNGSTDDGEETAQFK